jgi:4-alpha-glucanotransferase
MISIEDLLQKGVLAPDDFPPAPTFKPGVVEFRTVETWKGTALRAAFENFQLDPPANMARQFERFMSENRDWLDDFSLYQALRERYGGTAWNEWPSDIRNRESSAILKAVTEVSDEIAFHKFVQYLFQSQWDRLKLHANRRGVAIMGDIPIYVALESADVWANQQQFLLDDDGQPSVQAGVPPDLFTADGQLWGNPVYDWELMAADGYAWWEKRIRRALELTDIVRIDHFRGFAAGWQVPADETTARNGEWVTGPGKAFFDQMSDRIGRMPIVVEDLGVITSDVEALRDELGYPGMKVLQFAFGDGPENPYLPHNVQPNSMMYTGTHDNETSVGWYTALPADEQRHVRRYLRAGRSSIHRDMISAAWASVAVLACTPVQDLAGLGNEARMNVPGKATGNWGWRMEDFSAIRRRQRFLRALTELYGRDNPPLAEQKPFNGSSNVGGD